ncbi:MULTISPECIES: LysR family transcriptional regulator [unclassified Burkholderia]|uniref:LysR family transcriptional regulator n=1 Tax=unclassified Burkholderia TaxID=2613784 RepID=UPI00084C2386|nr:MULTISPECIES: LysR family transcriptional regulator [unclassified Burkholderia]RQU18059.1 LysR family transcriptional regulator [Burkholderia cenocepacia]MBR8237691.1 LysR family transcriptional regulator [Burkholderia sp. AU32357]MBY4871465.1 LysR family transcriptional regulator [Burkholderia sp. AU42008]OED12818.1 transcriptional regulator [Burkholderia sp. A2]OXI37548.1 LysR family transcriptional regulator [Burkholderia sp. AU17457]
MDTLLSMRVFTRIVETGSFTRASDTTGLTTPRVSALLSALEQHLGCRLLNRTTRRISLTEDGQAYYERAVAVLREIDDMEASVSQARNVPRGRLKVNLPPAMAKQVVVPALPAFLDAHPDIMIELGVTDRQIDLVGEGVDCVVRIGALDDSGMIARRIGSLTTCTCGSPAYFARCGEPETVDDLTQHVAVSHISADTGRPRPWDYVVDGEPRIVQMCGTVAVNDADNYIECGVAGIGLIKTSLYLVEPYLKSGRLREVLTDFNAPPKPISVLYPPNRHIPVKLKVFVDWLAGLFEQIPTLQGKRG